MTVPADIRRRLERIERETPSGETVAELLRSADWIAVERVVLSALDQFPTTRADLVRALEDLRDGPAPRFGSWTPTAFEAVRTVVINTLEHDGPAKLAVVEALDVADQ